MINIPFAQSPSQISYQLPSAKTKKPWLLISLTILLLGATGVLGYQNYQLKSQLKNTQSKSLNNQVNILPQPIDLTDWSIWNKKNAYKNNTQPNFSVRYPNNWEYNDILSKGFGHSLLTKQLSFNEKGGLKAGAYITFREHQNLKLNLNPLKSFFIDSLPAQKYQGKASDLLDPVDPHFQDNYIQLVSIDNHGEKFFIALHVNSNQLNYQKYFQIFDQILSSLQFINYQKIN